MRGMTAARLVRMKQATPLRILAVWSLIPTYMLAAGAIGYALDRWLHTSPYVLLVCLLVGFSFAIRDMLKLREEIFPKDGEGHA